MGLVIDNSNNFNSIEGVTLYLNSLRQVSEVSGRVSEWQSLDDSQKIFFQANSLRRPYRTNDLVDYDREIDSNPKLMSKSPETSMNFLHDGSPFGVYGIFGFEDADDTGNLQILDTSASATANGFFLRLNTTGSGTLNTRIIQSGVIQLNSTSGSLAGKDVIQSFAVVRNSLNESNNLKYYSNDSLVTQTSITAAATGNGLSFVIGNVQTAARFLMGVLVVCNWTGKTSAEVATLDASVRELLELEKANFTYP